MKGGARGLLFVALAAWALLPLVLLLVLSLSRSWFFPEVLPARWTTASWRALGGSGRLATALLNSAALAVPAGIIATLIGWPVGRALARSAPFVRHAGAALTFLPVAVPPIALATGLHWSFLRLGMGGTFAGVLLAHAVPATGYASLFLLGIFTDRDERAEEAARTLGATPWQVRVRVTLPLLRRPLAEAWLLGFLVSWAQLPLTLLVGGGLVPTLPLEVFSFMQAGQDAFAATGALVITLPPILAIAAVRLAAKHTAALPA